MSRLDNEIRITPSVLDRLLDDEPDNENEAPKSRAKTLRELKQAIKRDLEWLLNTRQYPLDISPDLEEIGKSLVMYGLPDFTGMSAKNPGEQKKLVKQIETTLKFFEPRFLDLRVTFEPLNTVERVFKFKIEARLDIEPTPEPITFDTVLQLGSGEFEVKEK